MFSNLFSYLASKIDGFIRNLLRMELYGGQLILLFMADLLENMIFFINLLFIDPYSLKLINENMNKYKSEAGCEKRYLVGKVVLIYAQGNQVEKERYDLK